MKFDSNIPDAVRQMLAQFGSGIEYTEREPNGLVDLSRSEVTNEDLRHLIFYPGFDALILDDTHVSDVGMKFIGDINSLETLRLKDTLISDDGLHELSGLSKLERLHIGCNPGCFRRGQRPAPASSVRRNQISDRGLVHLTDLRSLNHLNLKATRVTDAGLSRYIPELPHLQGLSLAYLDMTDQGLRALESLTWLESVNLTHTAVSNSAIVGFALEKLHTLRRLNLSNTVVDDAALAGFLPQSQLHDLSLMDTGITDEGCREIAQCEWLARLRLDLTDITDDGVRDIADCPQLLDLELFETRITDTSLVWLSDTKVEALGLGCTSITDAGVPALTDFPFLQYLDLQATAVTDKGLRFLGPAPRLNQLFLEDTGITNAGIEHLLELALKSLSLNPGIEDDGLDTLSELVSLRHLAIWKAKVSHWQPLTKLNRLQVLLIDDSVRDLSSLSRLRQLKVLLLWGDHFSPAQVAKLRLSLPQCQIVEFARKDPAICEFRKLCRCG